MATLVLLGLGILMMLAELGSVASRRVTRIRARRRRDRATGRAARAGEGGLAREVELAGEVDPGGTEAAVVAMLVAGVLTRDQYHQRMAELAARDARRHPLVVPPA